LSTGGDALKPCCWFSSVVARHIIKNNNSLTLWRNFLFFKICLLGTLVGYHKISYKKWRSFMQNKAFGGGHRQKRVCVTTWAPFCPSPNALWITFISKSSSYLVHDWFWYVTKFTPYCTPCCIREILLPHSIMQPKTLPIAHLIPNITISFTRTQVLLCKDRKHQCATLRFSCAEDRESECVTIG
jgi:hypothetical protein